MAINVFVVFGVTCMLAGLAPAQAQPFWPHFPARRVTLLDGTWQFGFRKDIADVLSVKPRDAVITTTIAVPSAFDVAQPGILGPRGTAFYRTNITVTPNTEAVIQFAACGFYCKIFLDDEEVGENRAGGYQPFWVPLPPAAAADRTLLVVADNRFNSTTAPTATGGDFYFYSGLTRNVVLHELPAGLAIARAAVLPVSVSPPTVDVTVQLHQAYSGPLNLSLSWDGAPPITVSTSAAGGSISLAKLTVPSAEVWSFESPNLCILTITLANGDAIAVRFGLREVSIVKGRLALNGQVIQLRGVNRHTMWPSTGSAVTPDQIEQDVALLKELGVNFVRGAHYPQDQRFLDRLDEVGIGLWEETLGPGVKVSNLEDPYFLKYQVEAVHNMIDASINHPSVLLYGFYNEGPSSDHKACPGYNVSAAAIRARTGSPPAKLVTWASDKKTSDVCLDIADVVSFNSYPAWYDHKMDLNEPARFWASQAAWVRARYPKKAFFISETGAGGVYEWSNASAPYWSLQYQQEVVTADVRFAVNSSLVSGITLWQFADIKANDEGTASCGPCVYEPHPPTLAQPWTCAYINVNCNRPGGENHKGMVDFWRRKKPVFEAVKALYKAPQP